MIGEAAGALAAFCIERRIEPTAVRATESRLRELQSRLTAQGVEIEWPRLSPVRSWDHHLAYTANPEGAQV